MKGIAWSAMITAALLFGCASDKAAQTETDEVAESSAEKAAESRAETDATVYDEDAHGGSGSMESVTPEDSGETWDTQGEPSGDEPVTPEDPGTGGGGEVYQDDTEETEAIESDQSGMGGSGEAKPECPEPSPE